MLRSVCRSWGHVADWVRLASSELRVGVSTLAHADAARLVIFVEVSPCAHDQSPINLRSLVARARLRKLVIGCPRSWSPIVYLAELFVGGVGLPALRELFIGDLTLEWDTTDLAGAPTAAEFATRARALLLSLVNVGIGEPWFSRQRPGPPPDGFIEACQRLMLPALRSSDDGSRASRRYDEWG